MTPYTEQAIKDAVERGGYDKSILEMIESAISQHEVDNAVNIALLDHLFWQALGKARGWKELTADCCGITSTREHRKRKHDGSYTHFHSRYMGKFLDTWLINQHDLINYLAAGLDAESFFKSL